MAASSMWPFAVYGSSLWPALLFMVLLWWLDALGLLDSPECSDNDTHADPSERGL